MVAARPDREGGLRQDHRRRAGRLSVGAGSRSMSRWAGPDDLHLRRNWSGGRSATPPERCCAATSSPRTSAARRGDAAICAGEAMNRYRADVAEVGDFPTWLPDVAGNLFAFVIAVVIMARINWRSRCSSSCRWRSPTASAGRLGAACCAIAPRERPGRGCGHGLPGRAVRRGAGREGGRRRAAHPWRA